MEKIFKIGEDFYNKYNTKVEVVEPIKVSIDKQETHSFVVPNYLVYDLDEYLTERFYGYYSTFNRDNEMSEGSYLSVDILKLDSTSNNITHYLTIEVAFINDNYYLVFTDEFVDYYLEHHNVQFYLTEETIIAHGKDCFVTFKKITS